MQCLPKQATTMELQPLRLACAAQVGPEGRHRGIRPLWLAHHVWVRQLQCSKQTKHNQVQGKDLKPNLFCPRAAKTCRCPLAQAGRPSCSSDCSSAWAVGTSAAACSARRAVVNALWRPGELGTERRQLTVQATAAAATACRLTWARLCCWRCCCSVRLHASHRAEASRPPSSRALQRAALLQRPCCCHAGQLLSCPPFSIASGR